MSNRWNHVKRAAARSLILCATAVFSGQPAQGAQDAGPFPIVANTGGKCGYVDAKGKWLIPAKFDYADRYYPDGLAIVGMVDQQATMIDRQGKVQITAPEGLWIADYQRDDVFLQVDDGEHTGFIDRTGAIKIPLIWDEAEGFAGHSLAPVKLKGRWGFIDREGKLRIETKFESASSFKAGNAKVRLDGVEHHLREDGTMEPLPPETEEPFVWADQRKIGELYYFSKNKFGVQSAHIHTAKGPMLVLLDANKKPVSKPYNYIDVYDDPSLFLATMGDYSEGSPPSKYGFIGLDGKVKISLIFSEARGFDGKDSTFVALNGKWGSIDRKGRWVIQPKFERLGECSVPTVRVSR
jgi:hypothetical protein